MEGLVVEVDENVLLLVGDEGDQFFYSFGEGPFLALVVVGKMRVEVKLLLFLAREEFQDLDQNLSNFRVELYMVLRFFTNFVSKEPQAILYLFIALLLQVFFHLVEAVKELEKPDETANNFYLEEALFLGLVLREVIVGLGDLSDDENHFLNLEGNFEILLFNLNEHS